jgi:hypothetical protein
MSGAHGNKSIITFGATNPTSVATSDLFTVCNENGNLPIVLLPTHGQRPPPKLSAASNRLISKEASARQEAAVAKHIAEKAKKKNTPITLQKSETTQKEPPAQKQKEQTMSAFEEAEDIGSNDSEDTDGEPDVDGEDVQDFLSEDSDEEEGDVVENQKLKGECAVYSY